MAKVLLVEDDNNLREIYEARLVAEGYEITSAQDGEEALVVAKASKPDLIISDVMMPKISGFEMLDILRNTQGLKETKVIMLTALGQADDRTRADSLGADRYLVKSQVTLEDIVKAAHELLEGGDAPAAQAPEVTADAPAPAAVPEPVAAAPAAPTPEIAVSAPPTDSASVAVTPAPDAVTPAPTATPTTDAPEPAAAAEPVTSPDPAVPEPAAEPEAPAAPASVIAPTESIAPTEPAAESAPSIELPTLPSEEAAPTAATEAPTNPALPETETTAEEQATVDNQIEDFIKNNAVEVPTETPASPPPNNITDQIMKESVDTLIASTEQGSETPAAPAATEPTTTPTEVAPEPQAPIATSTDDEEESSDGVTIAHKKVIARPTEATSKPDLNELLAREEAKKIVLNEAPVVTSEAPAPVAPTPAGTGGSALPGNTVAPTNGAAPKASEDVDPNSIAL